MCKMGIIPGQGAAHRAFLLTPRSWTVAWYTVRWKHGVQIYIQITSLLPQFPHQAQLLGFISQSVCGAHFCFPTLSVMK